MFIHDHANEFLDSFETMFRPDLPRYFLDEPVLEEVVRVNVDAGRVRWDVYTSLRGNLTRSAPRGAISDKNVLARSWATEPFDLINGLRNGSAFERDAEDEMDGEQGR